MSLGDYELNERVSGLLRNSRTAGTLDKGSAMHTTLRENPDASERAFIDQAIANQSDRPGALLGILEAVQDHNPRKYLPMETLRYVAAKTGIPPSQVFSVATFYALFNLQPQGDNTICICRGTACHTRGSRNLLDSLRLELGVGQADESGDTDDADKVGAHDRGPEVHGAHRRMFRAMRAGPGGRNQPQHLRPCE